ncbi:MAG: alpha/beta hydrolase [Pseudomonadota bacterium]
MILQILLSVVPFAVFFIGALISTLFAATGVVTILLVALAIYTEHQKRRIEAEHPPKGRFVTVRGVRMHVLERNAEAGGVPVLLLHGAASNADDIMVSAGEALGDRHCIAIDRPGHGYSERPAPRDASSPIVQSKLIAEALAEMGVERAIVLGHSWGGCCALTLALRYPKLVESLVLLAPVTHPWRGKISWYWRLSANRWFGWLFYRTLAMPVGQASIRPALKMTFAPNAVPDDYIERAGITRIFRPKNFAANSEDMVDLWDNVNWLSSQYPCIAAPTIILQGDEDVTLWPELHAESLVRQMPKAELRMLPGVGHLPNYFAKAEIAGAVAELESARTAELHVA